MAPWLKKLIIDDEGSHVIYRAELCPTQISHPERRKDSWRSHSRVVKRLDSPARPSALLAARQTVPTAGNKIRKS